MSDSVTRILKLLKQEFGKTFKTYYDGDPEQIPLFNLPCIIVDQTGDDTEGSAFGQDDVTDHMVVKVVLNKADDWDGDSVKPLNLTSRKVRDLIGKLDKDTQNFAPKTIKHVLRNTLFDDAVIISNSTRTEYGVAPRGNGENPGFVDITAEGHVTFDITYSRNVEP